MDADQASDIGGESNVEAIRDRVIGADDHCDSSDQGECNDHQADDERVHQTKIPTCFNIFLCLFWHLAEQNQIRVRSRGVFSMNLSDLHSRRH